jgi:NTE family protein
VKALVFSAGGAFGAYEAGAWTALEERGFRPAIVVGASVGALSAIAVARGCTGQRLQALWRDPASNVFRWNWPPRSLGLLDQAVLAARIEELLAQFPQAAEGVKLLITVTELPGTRIRTVSDEQVTARRLLASCAVPLAYAPVRLEGRWYCDGGVFWPLPLLPAAEAGATEIVGVDLLGAPPSALAHSTMTAAIRVRRWALGEPDGRAAPAGVRVVRIVPRAPLGRLRDILRWSPENVERWIEAGYRDAAAAWERESQARAAQESSPRAERTAPA